TPIDEAVLFIDGSRGNEFVDWTADDPVVVVEDPEVKVTAYADLYDWPNTRGAPPSRLVSDRIPIDVASGDDAEVTLQLEPRSVLLGRLLGDPTGSTSSSVFMIPLRPGETFDATVKLNDPLSTWARNGTFSFYGLRPGPHEVGVFGEDEMPANHRTIEIVDGLNEIELERERLDPSGCMVVRSFAPNGRRMERVRYWFEYEKPGMDPDTGWASTRQNVDGVDLIDMDDFDEFDYRDWPAGTRMWLIGKTDAYGQARVEISPGQMEAELQFQPPCELEVKIHGDTSIGSYRIVVYDDAIEREDPRSLAMASQGRRGSDTRIRRSGVATFRGLAPGPVVVALKHESQWWGDGVEIARQELTLVGSDHRVEFQAVELCDLSIVVTPVDNDQNFSIRHEEEDGDEQYLGWGSTTDDGRLLFRGLPPGDYIVALGEKGARLDVTLPCSEIRWDISEHVTKLTVSVSKADGQLASWGLQGGDLITAIDGEPVEDSEQLLARLDEEGVTVTVERGEETLELDLPHYPRKTRGENPLGGWMYISDD
ncbi:MAG: PDZ domain-containing protein, partial [Planctomycetota bacterium]